MIRPNIPPYRPNSLKFPVFSLFNREFGAQSPETGSLETPCKTGKKQGIPANEKFDVRDYTLTISLTDQQRSDIQARREHIWLLIGVWFKDWFGIKRHEEFLLRWKPSLEPGDRPGTRIGFITHDDAQ